MEFQPFRSTSISVLVNKTVLVPVHDIVLLHAAMLLAMHEWDARRGCA